MAIANGIITHLDAEGRFAYLTESAGSSVRIHGKLKDFDQLEKGSEVVLQYDNEFVNGVYKKSAKTLLEIKPPYEPVTVLGTVVRVSDKGFAFARCDTFEDDVHIGADVFRKADVKPGRDMPILVTIGLTTKGFTATELRWKPEEIAAWWTENLPSETGTLKYFDPKGFGFLIREDGSQIGFHIMGAAADLRDGFKKKYRKGSTFAFVVGDYRGKPTALITELVALAQERVQVEVGEDEISKSDVDPFAPLFDVPADVVAVEAIAPVEEVVAAPEAAAVVESETKPAKAPRKKATPKPKGKVTGKSGGIPSARDYGVRPDDQPVDVKTIAQQCILNGSGGSMAEAFVSAK